MTDFLKELEVQMTAAAHRAAAERARPPRPKRWPTLAFVAGAAVAILAMVVMPSRPATMSDQPAKPATASLTDVRVGAYNGAGIDGAASTATRVLGRHGAVVTADNLPPDRERAYSKVYFAKGHAAQARSVMKALGVERVGSPLPNLGDGRSYDVVVLLGKDFATPAKRLLDAFALLREAPNRTIDTEAGPARVIATQAGLCLQVRDHAGWGGTCADVTEALGGMTVASIRRSDGRLQGAVGLVPDGIASVQLSSVDGTASTLPVGRNLWAIGSENIVSVTFGSTTVNVP